MGLMKFFLLALSFTLLMGATPDESGYSSVPKKREAFGGRDDLQSVREEAVKPNEVFLKGVQEVAIIATETGYLPSKIIVRRGIPVRIFLTSASPQALCFSLDDFPDAKRGARNQQVEVITLMPEQPGQYKFSCPIGALQGTLVVRD